MGRVVGVFGRIAEGLARTSSAFSAGGLAVVVGLNALEIVSRRLGRSSPLLVELTVLLATATYFVGYAALLWRDEDVVVEYVYERLPAGVRRWLDLGIALAVLAFFLVLVAKAVALFRLTWPMRHPVFAVSYSYTTLPLVVGAVLCLWVAAQRALVAAARLRTEGRQDTGAPRGHW